MSAGPTHLPLMLFVSGCSPLRVCLRLQGAKTCGVKYRVSWLNDQGEMNTGGNLSACADI